MKKPTSSLTIEFYKPETYRLQGSIVYSMVRNKLIYERLADSKLVDLGITASQMRVLMMIAHTERATVSSISSCLANNAAASVRTIDKLQRNGWIKRSQSERDKRVTYLSLTVAGRKLSKAIPSRLCGLLNNSLEGFTHQEFELFKSFLMRIENNNLRQLEGAYA